VLDDTALLITARRRPDYLRETLLSWSECPEISRLSRIVIALGQSHRWDDQLDVIARAGERMGREIEVLRDSQAAYESPGMHRALGEGIDKVFERGAPGFLICGEEDVVVSDDVLSYFEWAQHWYSEGVLCVLAHNKGGCGWDGLAEGTPRRDGAADQSLARKLPYFNPWVWMVRRGVWASVIRPLWDWDCTSGGDQDSGYDWQMSRLSQMGLGLNIVPDAARSQTIGEFGGVCSLPYMLPLQRAQSFRRHRGRVEYRMATG
jgi:hypothetical protein